MPRTAEFIFAFAITTIFISPPVAAQTQTAQVTGTVTDQTGAVIRLPPLR